MKNDLGETLSMINGFSLFSNIWLSKISLTDKVSDS